MNRTGAWRKYLILAVLSCTIASCSGAIPDRDREMVSNFRVAMVMPQSTNDRSWGEAGQQGLQLIQHQLIAKTAYTSEVHNLPDNQLKTIFSQYGEQGFDFVIGESDTYIPAMENAAQKFPRAKFAVLDIYPGNNINLGSLSFRDGELGYLCGVVAALKSKTNQVSLIGDTESARGTEVATLFERGAQSINPEIIVHTVWLNRSRQAVRPEDVAKAEITSGSDVLLVRIDQGASAVHQLASAMQVHTIGWVKDQYSVAPGTVLTSGIQRVPELLLHGATLVRKGRWEGKQYRFGLREGVQDLAPFRGMLTSKEEAIVEQAKEDILTGQLDVSL